MKVKRNRKNQDAVNRTVFVNHRQRGIYPDKVWSHPHYQQGFDFGYKDALAGNRTHEERRHDRFYAAGYAAAMRQYGGRALARALWEWKSHIRPLETRPPTWTRREWRKWHRSR